MSQSHRNKNAGRGTGAARQLKREPANSKPSTPESILLSPRVMRAWALPQPDEAGDKEERGRVLVIGGAPEMPGAVILAATAALRAGAGKVQIATCRSISQTVGASVPEARVFALPETKAGGIAASAAPAIAERANDAQAVLIGPGMLDEKAIARLLKSLLPRIDGPTLVLDAGALLCLTDNEGCLKKLNQRVVLTPHAGEMAALTGVDKERIEANPANLAQEAARKLRAVIALKGRETFIAAPAGKKIYCNRTGNVGLATSGSGDTLSGIIAGLAARGAPALQAAAWGVYLHGRAGDRLARKIGRLGFLARELLAEIPSLMADAGERKKR
ncbi:MAG TPA: NAD(P)H-hydrate dehydratase [Pyrinomonadaceae bacterium]